MGPPGTALRSSCPLGRRKPHAITHPGLLTRRLMSPITRDLEGARPAVAGSPPPARREAGRCGDSGHAALCDPGRAGVRTARTHPRQSQPADAGGDSGPRPWPLLAFETSAVGGAPVPTTETRRPGRAEPRWTCTAAPPWHQDAHPGGESTPTATPGATLGSMDSRTPAFVPATQMAWIRILAWRRGSAARGQPQAAAFP